MKICHKIMGAGIMWGGLVWSGLPALAAPPFDFYPENIDAREERQQERIFRGVQSGEITPREYRRLEKEQARIQAAENRMRPDGRLSPWERARLNAMLDRSSRHINQARFSQNYHGARHRPHGPGHPHYQRPGVNAREARQRARIYQGVRSGQIAPGEFRRLGREQARIRAAEARMRADGRFTQGERARLQQRLNRSSAHISQARHKYRTMR